MSFRFAQPRLFAGGGVAAVLVALVVGAFALGMNPLSEDAAIAPMRTMSDRELDSVSGRIAFVSDRDGDDEIYVMNGDGSGLVQLTDNGSADRYPVWSPDSGRIAFTSDRDNDVEIYDIYVMNADGSGVEQLTDGCSNYHLAWSPDGGRFAFVSRGDIYVMNADGGDVVQLTGNAPGTCGELFFSDRDGDGYSEAYVRNADGSVELFTDYDALDWDTVDWFPSWSPDSGRIVFQSHRDGDMEIYMMNPDGSGIKQLTYNTFPIDYGPAWSPDSDRIAFYSDRDGATEIYVMNPDGSGVERLTYNQYDDYFPAWSPDGSRIVFTSKRDGDYMVYVMNADGSGVVRLAEGSMPVWSPLLD